MLANTWQIELDINPHRPKHIRWSDTTVLQHVRAPDGATGENDFFPDSNRRARSTFRKSVLDIGCSHIVNIRSVEQDTSDSSIGQDVEVCSWRQRVDVSVTSFRSGPVRGVNRGRRDEPPKWLSAQRIRTSWDTSVLQCRQPTANDRKSAEAEYINQRSGARRNWRTGTHNPG